MSDDGDGRPGHFYTIGDVGISLYITLQYSHDEDSTVRAGNPGAFSKGGTNKESLTLPTAPFVGF
jgi:hypothetical protein